jgi:hypothetical protein
MKDDILYALVGILLGILLANVIALIANLA